MRLAQGPASDSRSACRWSGSGPPLRKNGILRVYGTGPTLIDTAASHWTYDTTGAAHVPGRITAHSVVLTNKDNATYATTAVALGAEKDGPVMMTSAGSLDASAAIELKRVLPKGGTVYLNGNTARLSSTVADQVAALGYKVLRMDGPDLASISVRVAKQIAAKPSWIFIADGNDYHDPIAAASAAGALGYRGTGVVLLSNGTTLPSSVTSYLNSLDLRGTTVVSVGGNAVVALSKALLDSQDFEWFGISGATYEDDAAKLARFWWTAPSEATVEDTWTWQNAVTGQAVSASHGPMLWSTEATLSSQASYYLGQESASIDNVRAFGGNVSFPIANRNAIGNAIAVDNSWAETLWYVNGDVPTAPTASTAATRSLHALTSPVQPSAGSVHSVLGSLHPTSDPKVRAQRPTGPLLRHAH